MKTETAYLAGGCFWGMQDLIRKQPGVVTTEVGYTGGQTVQPVYKTVKTGSTGHAEAIKIIFDPNQTSFEKILLFFFKIHDPTTVNRQGNDIGSQYRSAIFYTDENQKQIAENVKTRVQNSQAWKLPVVTELTAFTNWWPAEDDHQDYLERYPDGYTCHFLRKVDF